MKAIVLSGMPAAGKTTVAHILGQRLGIKVVGIGDILKEIASEHGYTPGGEGWWETPDGIKFHKERDSNPEFDKEADRKLVKLINGGNVIVTSYTAPWIAEDGFRIWLSAQVKNRAERMAKRDNTEYQQAIKATKMRDEEDYKLYKNLYDFDLGKDLKPFDLVVDTDNITAEQVADIIINKVNELHI